MLNTITIAGRLVRDPELRRTNSGTAVASMTLACDRDYSKDGERETDFVDVTAWGKTAEFCDSYFSKGRMAIVTGRLQMRKWQDKEGHNRVTAEVNADHVYFGDSKRDGQDSNTKPVENGVPADFAPIEEEDEQLPF